MYQHTAAGSSPESMLRRSSFSSSASSSSTHSSLPSHFFLRAQHYNNGQPQSMSLVPCQSHQEKQALLAAISSPLSSSSIHSCVPSRTGDNKNKQQRPRAMLIPHMDDLDEEIQALGYEKAMVAGASAGVSEHVFMFPVDTVKTRMQALQADGAPRYKNVVDGFLRIAREEGILRLYRGFPVTVLGAIPSHAVHYATYEKLKHQLGGNEAGHHPLIHGLSGGIATMAHDAIVTPMDVVKQRLQVYNSSYSGIMQCIRTVFREEGLRAFYASYPTTVAMNVPFQAVHFAAYESFKIFFTGEEDEHGVAEEIAAGGAAGALAGFVSTPFDVLKTRLQTQHVGPGQHRVGALEMMRSIRATEGMRAFMNGASARMLYYIPSAAICWTTYETMKRVLKDAW